MDNQKIEEETAIKKDSNGKIFVIIICLFIFVLMMIGISISTFTYTKEGNNNVNTISTGNIHLSYVENNNGINIKNVYPVTDSIGKTLTDENYYFDFTVDATITGDVVANYEISAEKLNTSTLSNNEVKLYLEKVVDNKYVEVMEPKHFTPLNKKTSLGTPEGSMMLDEGTFNKSDSVKYRLRMWIDKDTVVGALEKNFGVTVSVKAKVDLKN